MSIIIVVKYVSINEINEKHRVPFDLSTNNMSTRILIDQITQKFIKCSYLFIFLFLFF